MNNNKLFKLNMWIKCKYNGMDCIGRTYVIELKLLGEDDFEMVALVDEKGDTHNVFYSDCQALVQLRMLKSIPVDSTNAINHTSSTNSVSSINSKNPLSSRDSSNISSSKGSNNARFSKDLKQSSPSSSILEEKKKEGFKVKSKRKFSPKDIGEC